MAWGAKGPLLRVMSLGGAGGRTGGRLLYGAARPGRGAEVGVVLAVVGLICLSGLAWAQNPVPPTTVAPVSSLRPAASSASPNTRAGARYVVAKDDLLEVYVIDAQELSREYLVDEDGMITLPMLPRPVMAEGLTLDQLSEAIRRDLLDAGLLTDPQVVVTVKSSPLNSVILSGAVKNRAFIRSTFTPRCSMYWRKVKVLATMRAARRLSPARRMLRWGRGLTLPGPRRMPIQRSHAR